MYDHSMSHLRSKVPRLDLSRLYGDDGWEDNRSPAQQRCGEGCDEVCSPRVEGWLRMLKLELLIPAFRENQVMTVASVQTPLEFVYASLNIMVAIFCAGPCRNSAGVF